MLFLDPDPDESPTASRRRREIALAARSEVMAKGFEGLRMRSVADRAGINVATLDYHAGGKDGLVALIARSIAEDFRAQHLSTDRSGMTGIEELAQEIRDFREIRIAYPDIHPVMGSLARRSVSDPEIARYSVPMKQFWHDKLTQMVARGVADGTVRADIDPGLTARLLIWAMVGLGSPENAGLSFPAHATELLRLIATGPVDDFTGDFR